MTCLFDWKKNDVICARYGGEHMKGILAGHLAWEQEETVEGSDLKRIRATALTAGKRLREALDKVSVKSGWAPHEDFLLIVRNGRFYFLSESAVMGDHEDFEPRTEEEGLLGPGCVAMKWSRLAAVSVDRDNNGSLIHCDLTDNPGEAEDDHLHRLAAGLATAEGFDGDLVTMSRRIKPLFSIANVGGLVATC